MKSSLHDQYVAALTGRGYDIVRRGKRTVIRDRWVAGRFFFVGSRGSLRYGPCFSRSTPVGEIYTAPLLASLPDAALPRPSARELLS